MRWCVTLLSMSYESCCMPFTGTVDWRVLLQWVAQGMARLLPRVVRHQLEEHLACARV